MLPCHLPVPVPNPVQITIFRDTRERHQRARSPMSNPMALSNRERNIGFNRSPSFLALIPTAPTLNTSQPPPFPLYLLKVRPKPLHDTRQMARQTDGPFTQASRNRRGLTRDKDMGTDGNVTRRGPGPWPPPPLLGGQEPAWGPQVQQTRGLASMTQERATMRIGEGVTI